MKWTVYLGKALKILLSFFSLGSTIWPSLFAVGLYAGLASGIAGLFAFLISSLSSVYNSFNQWAGGWSTEIISFFNDFQDNSWFSFLSYITSLDVPFFFLSDVVGKYVSFAVTGVLALFGSAFVLTLGIIGVIWVRRRVKMIVAGFGSHT